MKRSHESGCSRRRAWAQDLEQYTFSPPFLRKTLGSFTTSLSHSTLNGSNDHKDYSTTVLIYHYVWINIKQLSHHGIINQGGRRHITLSHMCDHGSKQHVLFVEDDKRSLRLYIYQKQGFSHPRKRDITRLYLASSRSRTDELELLFEIPASSTSCSRPRRSRRLIQEPTKPTSLLRWLQVNYV